MKANASMQSKPVPWAKTTTPKGLALRAAKPPLKSAVPHKAAEARESAAAVYSEVSFQYPVSSIQYSGFSDGRAREMLQSAEMLRRAQHDLMDCAQHDLVDCDSA
ncbi:MAG TPA: hypothetical protein VFP40_14490 [Terriglobales bacterium]|nr:hypothetical protein [Terriglobales bacterium]